MSQWWQAYEAEIGDLLRTYEQAVRERIASAIEAHADAVSDVEASGRGAGPQEDDYYAALHDAARIARDGGVA